MVAAKEKTFFPSHDVESMSRERLRNAAASTTINRIAHYDFRTRNSEKSPIGSKVKTRPNVAVENHQRPREYAGENTPRLRRSHWAPEKSQYRAYFLPNSVDPLGLVCLEPDVCGPDATGAFTQFLALIAPILRQMRRDLVTSVTWDEAVQNGLAIDWLEENGTSIDFWLGKAEFIKTQYPPCGTGKCGGTVELCGMCVRSTVPNNILYGIVAKMMGAWDWVIIAGAQANNVFKGQGIEGAEQRQAYRCGIKIWSTLLSSPKKHHSKKAICKIIKECAGTSFDAFEDCESCGKSAPLKDFKRGIGNGIALPEVDDE
jgi:hypothetical protein